LLVRIRRQCSGVDRLEHGRDLPHLGRRHVAEDVAIPVHDASFYGAFHCYRCATALGFRYASQQVSRKGRQMQSQRLRRFLGEYPGCTTFHKPLFMHRKTYSALLTRLRQIEAKPESRTYKSKRLTAATLKPNNMYRVQLAAVRNA
jgi:hypothetical protein